MSDPTTNPRRFPATLAPRTLQAQMILLVAALGLVQLVITGSIITPLIVDITEDHMGKRALDIAETVAHDPLVRRGLLEGDPDGEVQDLAESVRLATGAEFVVVCDPAGVRLSHPDAWKIGKTFVGGDMGPVVNEGRSYVSKAVGTLGPSLRGIAPVRGGGLSSDVIGFVAVGYLVEDVNRTIAGRLLLPGIVVLVLGLLGIYAAVLISRHFKRAILGLEPREIASLYRERGTILESLREGVIATDEHGTIRLANAAARKALDMAPDAELEGRPVTEVFPRAGIDGVLESGEPVHDREVVRLARTLVVNLVPVLVEGRAVGVVASFRRKDELDQLTHELAQTRESAEMRRVQAHEFSNTLHTIAGLIQLEAYQEALDMILRESTDFQDLIAFLGRAVPNPDLSGLILGKMNRARELKVSLAVDRSSSLQALPEWLDTDRLVTVVGNLLDNALEAAVGFRERPSHARLSLDDRGRDLVIEVEDSGPGVLPDRIETIFHKGVTSKNGDGHGVGLYLVAENLRELGGGIGVTKSDLGGASFTVIIPKQRTGGS